MTSLTDVLAVNLVSGHIFQFSATVGLQLLRARALPSDVSANDVYDLAARVETRLSASAGSEEVAKMMKNVQYDCADELLASGLLPILDPTTLLCISASRNFLATSRLLLERKADLHHVEVRRCRRRNIVDIAAHAASLDDDWRLVLSLLDGGAAPLWPHGVLFTPLRQGNVAMARRLLSSNVQCDAEGFRSLLCDMCSHGQLPAIALLLDEIGVPVNALNPRDGLTGTDRALAWHRWSTAEWLISERNGKPSKTEVALGSLLDAASDPCAGRVLNLLLDRKLLSIYDVLSAAVQRGDFNLCERLIAKMERPLASPVPGRMELTDLALCHGHLRIAHMLLKKGVFPRNPSRARADAWLHGGAFHEVAAEILRLIPATPGEQFLLAQDRMPHRHPASCASEVLPPASEALGALASSVIQEDDGMALVVF